MKSDEQLMIEFQNGLPDSFEELFNRYRNSVYAFFRRRLNSAGRAEELAQEASWPFSVAGRNMNPERSLEPTCMPSR
jgi:hypothetical protein